METRTRFVAVLAVAALALTAGGPVAAQTHSVAQHAPCAGSIDSPARGLTVVSVQGAHNGSKTPARQIAYGPNGSVVWMNPAGKAGVVWSYDVDPMANGHLFVTATVREGGEGKSIFYELNPETRERVWSVTLDMLDTHDADLINGGEQILIANMRNYNETTGRNNDRLAIYDRSEGEIVWEWRFAAHYPRSVGHSYTDDWTHVNDVDKIGPGRYLASPRNLDQAIVVDRSTGNVDLKLGSNGNTEILNQQHNPDYLETEDGDPTMLVGDSENDRIVEYTKRDGAWRRTWSLGNESTLHWPRDADRLPNGNTLVTDSRNHRVFEVTPEGEIVWEVYTPWLPYDAERVRYGGSSNGPAMADMNAPKDPALHGSEGGHRDPATLQACAAKVAGYDGSGVRLTVGTTERPSDGSTTGESSSRGTDTNEGTGATTTRAGESEPTTTGGGPGLGALGAVVAVLVLAVVARLTGVRARTRDR